MISIQRTGFMLILSAPSGTGKTSLRQEILEKNPTTTKSSVSLTTRPQRPGETEGEDYFFVSDEEFHLLRETHALLESAHVFGFWYGTPKDYVLQQMNQGKDVIFAIDWQGKSQLKDTFSESVVSVFLLPPSLEALESRLRKRGQDEEWVIQRRMKKAMEEINHWSDYDYVIVNEDFQDSVSQIQSILISERLKRERQVGLSAFINGF